MASAGDILDVRRNTNEPYDDVYSDDDLSALIDLKGVAGASAEVWGEKAAKYADLVDVTEAGASHKFSDLHKNALSMYGYWTGLVEVSLTDTRPKVRKIERL